jgi:hypothetical protein
MIDPAMATHPIPVSQVQIPGSPRGTSACSASSPDAALAVVVAAATKEGAFAAAFDTNPQGEDCEHLRD